MDNLIVSSSNRSVEKRVSRNLAAVRVISFLSVSRKPVKFTASSPLYKKFSFDRHPSGFSLWIIVSSSSRSVDCRVSRNRAADRVISFLSVSCKPVKFTASSALYKKFSFDRQPSGFSSVSYTHLDVYKRQVQEVVRTVLHLQAI